MSRDSMRAISDESLAMLDKLRASPAMGKDATVLDVIDHLIASAVDGVRRPGSWERQWVEQAFGAFE